jgi:hypothetical protein
VTIKSALFWDVIFMAEDYAKQTTSKKKQQARLSYFSTLKREAVRSSKT